LLQNYSLVLLANQNDEAAKVPSVKEPRGLVIYIRHSKWCRQVTSELYKYFRFTLGWCKLCLCHTC